MANRVSALETSFQDGCSTIASAITAKGVTTASNASPGTMAANISNIPTGSNLGFESSDILSRLYFDMIYTYQASAYYVSGCACYVRNTSNFSTNSVVLFSYNYKLGYYIGNMFYGGVTSYSPYLGFDIPADGNIGLPKAFNLKVTFSATAVSGIIIVQAKFNAAFSRNIKFYINTYVKTPRGTSCNLSTNKTLTVTDNIIEVDRSDSFADPGTNWAIDYSGIRAAGYLEIYNS